MGGLGSPVYNSPLAYQVMMRALYGLSFSERYRAIADLIPHGASVVEVACGDCYLYRHYLRGKGIHYLGLDLAPGVVSWGQQQGIPIRQFDLRREAVPTAEFVIMQGALCHFIPDHTSIVEKLQSAATKRLILSETVRDWQLQERPIVGRLARWITKPENSEDKYLGERFSEQSLRELLAATPGFISASAPIAGREIVAVLQGRGSSAGINETQPCDQEVTRAAIPSRTLSTEKSTNPDQIRMNANQ